MVSVLLAVIYLSFISLGLPDSLLGAAWPAMQPALGVPVSYAGILSMIIAGGTVLSSLLADRLLRRLGTGLVAAGSILLTAIALLGFSRAADFGMLCLSAIPYGLGAGAVDAALNHYVAVHYAAKHLSWLHCFWGIGCTVSPYIMSCCLRQDLGWQSGYRIAALIQLALSALLICSLPLWRRTGAESSESGAHLPLRRLLHLHGAPQSLLTFFCYTAMESAAGLWAGSFLVQARDADAQSAARYASLFYIGTALGRFLCGFVSEHLGERQLICAGLCAVTAGLGLMLLPHTAACYGLLLAGFGCAPVCPCLIHETPARFGRSHAGAVIGMQMASAYLGGAVMPPLLGLLTAQIGMEAVPLCLLVLLSLTALLTVPSARM